MKLPTQYKTHAIRSPISTHYRRATCKEINCEAYTKGWNYHKESLTPEMLYLVTHSGRKYNELHVREGYTYLIFESGQRCFHERTHLVRLERPEFYFVGRGDSRMFQPRLARQHKRADDFLDDWATHLDRIAERYRRGY